MLEDGFEFLFKCALRGCADNFVDNFASFDEEDGGDVADAEFGYEVIGVFFDVDLAYDGLAFVLVGQFLDGWADFAAWAAPCSPEVDDHGLALS